MRRNSGNALDYKIDQRNKASYANNVPPETIAIASDLSDGGRLSSVDALLSVALDLGGRLILVVLVSSLAMADLLLLLLLLLPVGDRRWRDGRRGDGHGLTLALLVLVLLLLLLVRGSMRLVLRLVLMVRLVLLLLLLLLDRLGFLGSGNAGERRFSLPCGVDCLSDGCVIRAEGIRFFETDYLWFSWLGDKIRFGMLRT